MVWVITRNIPPNLVPFICAVKIKQKISLSNLINYKYHDFLATHCPNDCVYHRWMNVCIV